MSRDRPRSPWPFLASVLLLTWGLQLPAVLAQRGLIAGPFERFLPLAMLGTFGPLLVALGVGMREEGLAGWRVPFRGLRAGGMRTGWALLALCGLPALHVAGTAVYALCGGDAGGRWFFPPHNAQQLTALLLVPWAEEPGWRGLALPRLQQRHGPIAASLLLGGVWAAWHTMMFLLQGVPPLSFALSWAMLAAGSVLATWLYNRTGGSLWSAVLFHMGAHLDNPFHALPADQTPFTIYTLAVCAAATAVVAVDERLGLPRARFS